MRRSVLGLFTSLALLVPAGLPDSELTVKDLQNHPFAVDFPSGSNLRVHLRSGEFRIVGRGGNKIAVHFNGRNADNARDLTVRFRRSGNDGDLRVFGGSQLPILLRRPGVARHECRGSYVEKLPAPCHSRWIATEACSDLTVGRGAEQLLFVFGPEAGLQMIFLQAERDPMSLDRTHTTPEAPGQFFVGDFAQQLFFRAGPALLPQWTDRWNVKSEPLPAHILVAATQAAR